MNGKEPVAALPVGKPGRREHRVFLVRMNMSSSMKFLNKEIVTNKEENPTRS